MMPKQDERKKRPRLAPDHMDAAVLAILTEAGQPLTAYAVQDRAAAGGLQFYPTQIYRTMHRLIEKHEVTRIESANAYAIQHDRGAAIAICRVCGKAVPVFVGRAIRETIDAIGSGGFEIDKLVVEAVGICKSCRGPG